MYIVFLRTKKNNILTIDGNNENVFNNFCKIIELQPYFVKEELIHYSASYDMISKSLGCEIKFDDSEEFEVTDGDEDNGC